MLTKLCMRINRECIYQDMEAAKTLGMSEDSISSKYETEESEKLLILLMKVLFRPLNYF